MKYKLGDFVRFVDENYEGHVTRIIDEQMIGVTGADDFEIPVLASKVTFVHGRQNEQTATSGSTIVSAGAAPVNFQERGIYLGVAPDKKANSVVHFYLINQTSYQLLATLFTEKDKQHVKGEFAGTIAAGSTAKVYSAQLAELQLWPKFSFQILLYAGQPAEVPQPVTMSDKFKAKDFAGAKKLLPLLNEQGWLIQLDEPELVIDAQQLKESFHKPAEEKVQIDKPAGEIDLHIEKLNPDYQALPGSEILSLQLTYFRKALEAAIVHQLPEITFIHGAGNGILRNELQKQLGKNQKVKTFMDARKEKFGYGATKVILK